MINLLPLEQKKEMRDQRRQKLFLVFELASIFFLLAVSLIFLASKAHLFGELNAKKTLLAQRRAEVSESEIAAFQKEVEQFNQELERVESFYDRQVAFASLLDRVTPLLPPGGYLRHVAIGAESGFWRLSLGGFAPTRQSLLDFKDRLEKLPDFSRVEFPPANWVQDASIDFSVELEMR
jgi:Tfp pilus assembly protein PilN